MKKDTVSSDGDLASFEGKYPAGLFNKTVVVGGQALGRVVRETDDEIVVFSDSGSGRFDIPKSAVMLSGGSVVVSEGESISQYAKDRDAPLPQGKSLRPSAEEIRRAASMQEQEESKPKTTPDRIMSEAGSLAVAPRRATVQVARPEGYVDTESELSKKMKRAARELKEIILAGAKVAKKQARKAREKADAKQAALDREAIGRMGALAGTFSESFEDILSEVRSRTYSDQVDIYTGFLKLLDQQRQLVVARRDLAVRLRDSVDLPVVEPDPAARRRLGRPRELPAPDKVSAARKLNQKGEARLARKSQAEAG